jgi:trimeric autotransporter adhesin
MRGPCIGFTCAVMLCAASLANAAPPTAPQVTMGADIKLLRFDWEPVAGAAYYQLRYRPGVGAAYQPLGERIPATITQSEQSLAVHLQDWAGMRFIVAACNSDGCTNSAALNPRSLMLDAIGYLKASNAEIRDQFGQAVALSADGYTLAVSAVFESSNASGVNGDQANNLSQQSGAVYVFRRRGNAWQQEAYLKAGTNQLQQRFGVDIGVDFHATALSADGSILAVAAPREDVQGVEDAGTVYVFRRTRNAWRLVATLHAPELLSVGIFGSSLDLSHDGRTLKVMSILRHQSVGPPDMQTHIFVRPANAWQHAVTLAPFYPGDQCAITRLSGDGQTLVSNCVTIPPERAGRIITMKRAGNAWVHAADLPTPFYNERQPIGLNFAASVMALSESRRPNVVGVYRWNGANWARETGLAGPVSTDPFYIGYWGYDLAFNDTGQLLAISDPWAREANAGVATIMMPGPADLGAVYLYRVDSPANTWSLRNVVKSARPGFRDVFGLSIALSGSGRTLAVGAPGENSSATGIDGVRQNEDAQNAGAAYLY